MRIVYLRYPPRGIIRDPSPGELKVLASTTLCADLRIHSRLSLRQSLGILAVQRHHLGSQFRILSITIKRDNCYRDPWAMPSLSLRSVFLPCLRGKIWRRKLRLVALHCIAAEVYEDAFYSPLELKGGRGCSMSCTDPKLLSITTQVWTVQFYRLLSPTTFSASAPLKKDVENEIKYYLIQVPCSRAEQTFQSEGSPIAFRIQASSPDGYR